MLQILVVAKEAPVEGLVVTGEHVDVAQRHQQRHHPDNLEGGLGDDLHTRWGGHFSPASAFFPPKSVTFSLFSPH